MSTEPKPASGELHHPSCRESDKDLVWFCNQCGAKESAEPATGDWTAARIVKFLGLPSSKTEDCSFLADDINTALAAERKRMDALLDRQDKGHAEYAAKMTKELTAHIADRKQLRAQLEDRTHELSELEIAYRRVYDDRESKEKELADLQRDYNVVCMARDSHAKQLDAVLPIRIELEKQLAALEGVLADDTGKAALAAAIAEATKPLATANLRLVDALEQVKSFCPAAVVAMIDAALAKVGK